MSRYVQRGSIGLIIAIIVIGLCLIWYGAIELNEAGNAPVYISEEFEIFPGYTIQGKIKNRTSNDIYISSITVLCSSNKVNNTVHTATWTKSNITVPANGEVSIYESGLSAFGNYNAQYNSVSWVSCEINGKKYYLESSKDGNTTGDIILIALGGILCCVAILIIIWRWAYN